MSSCEGHDEEKEACEGLVIRLFDSKECCVLQNYYVIQITIKNKH